MSTHTVGVVGAGVMGIGVSQSLAQAGHRVLLLDISYEILQRARAQIANNIRLQYMWKKQAAPEPIEQVLERITFTTDYAPFAEADFVIENVTEKWEIKREVHTQLDAVCPAHCVFAVNTSAISITRVAGVTQRPAQVLGMHFMNPVPMKKTVEVIRGYHTSQETLDTALALLASMDKEGIVVNDMPGFVSNRVLMLTVNEAIFLVQDQVAQPAEIDTIFKSCFGHTMGPLETADLIGLDTILYSIEVLYESYNDSKYRPCPLLKKMVDAGLYGRKSGQGFYHYA
ncbi:MAG TPA: 3-hydroxyacyl-CoA dehydrogenase NAD-binding domain-containing protein [Ktedonobacteraceae bacterium]|nr:3-hydroxyacyl-CoA dehydrogenase NAD-binding domain-containing protein [Ktedonobacteraceae bacterium]